MLFGRAYVKYRLCTCVKSRQMRVSGCRLSGLMDIACSVLAHMFVTLYTYVLFVYYYVCLYVISLCTYLYVHIMVSSYVKGYQRCGCLTVLQNRLGTCLIVSQSKTIMKTVACVTYLLLH